MKRNFVSFKLVGGAYKRGFYHSGFTLLIDDQGDSLYFNEETSLNSAMDKAEAMGHCVEELRAKVEHWIKTGTGVSFSLRQ